jgi:hypothetical protein
MTMPQTTWSAEYVLAGLAGGAETGAEVGGVGCGLLGSGFSRWAKMFSRMWSWIVATIALMAESRILEACGTGRAAGRVKVRTEVPGRGLMAVMAP